MPVFTVATDLNYGEHAGQQYEIFVPQDANDQPLTILIPGGWWRDSSTATLRSIAWQLAEENVASAVISTRALGKAFAMDGHAIIEDVKEGIKACVEEASLYGCRQNGPRLIATGSGCLSALLASAELFDDELYFPSQILCASCPPSLKAWDGCPDDVRKDLDRFIGKRNPVASPETIAADRYPPAFFLHGDADEVVPAAQARELYRHLLSEEESNRFTVLSGAGANLIETMDGRVADSVMNKILSWTDR